MRRTHHLIGHLSSSCSDSATQTPIFAVVTSSGAATRLLGTSQRGVKEITQRRRQISGCFSTHPEAVDGAMGDILGEARLPGYARALSLSE